MNDIIEQLQTKLAFLEAANGELSDVVYRQQREIDTLRERLGVLTSQFQEFQQKPQEWMPADEKPPHY